MNNVKVYGIQRSGNNWLMWMLSANYQVNVLGNAFGWTHGGYNPQSGSELNLVIVKHPLAWLPSIHRYRGKGSFEQSVLNSKEILQWNNHYKGLLDALNVSSVPWAIITYQKLIADAQATLSEALSPVNPTIKNPNRPFRVDEGYMGVHGVPTKNKFDARYYINRKYLDLYNKKMLKHVANKIDAELLSRLGLGGNLI